MGICKSSEAIQDDPMHTPAPHPKQQLSSGLSASTPHRGALSRSNHQHSCQDPSMSPHHSNNGAVIVPLTQENLRHHTSRHKYSTKQSISDVINSAVTHCSSVSTENERSIPYSEAGQAVFSPRGIQVRNDNGYTSHSARHHRRSHRRTASDRRSNRSHPNLSASIAARSPPAGFSPRSPHFLREKAKTVPTDIYRNTVRNDSVGHRHTVDPVLRESVDHLTNMQVSTVCHSHKRPRSSEAGALNDSMRNEILCQDLNGREGEKSKSKSAVQKHVERTCERAMTAAPKDIGGHGVLTVTGGGHILPTVSGGGQLLGGTNELLTPQDVDVEVCAGFHGEESSSSDDKLRRSKQDKAKCNRRLTGSDTDRTGVFQRLSSAAETDHKSSVQIDPFSDRSRRISDPRAKLIAS
eukprot:173434_1